MSEPLTEAQGRKLLQWIVDVTGLEQMPDDALGDCLTDEVWGQMPLGSRQRALLAEAIARLKRAHPHVYVQPQEKRR
jgi:hypothetical protein